MVPRIRLLDCTLRDGGHINQGRFGETVIRNTIEKLAEAGVDIIEAGFLWNQIYGPDVARYYTIADVKRVLPSNLGHSKISLMADFIDLDHLEPYDGTVEFIRLSFKRHRLDWGLQTAKVLMDKGYKVFINPVNNNVYSDEEYIQVLQKVNELHPYGFSIVDTFGVMRLRDFAQRYELVENNLLPDITIGAHFHENLGLAYSLAQHFTQIAKPTRNIVIDGSLLGMGRVPGNLCMEQIMDYMNDQFGTHYATAPVYDAIDDYIAPIKAKCLWGYAIPYALSAKYYLHRTYAEYLMEKNRLKTKDIQRILSQVDPGAAETFDGEYIEKLYQDYMRMEYDDSGDRTRLAAQLRKYERFVVIAPGRSIVSQVSEIKQAIEADTCVMAVNFNSDVVGIPANYIFLTNMKRYDGVRSRSDNTRLIVTSNLIRDIQDQDDTLSYHELTSFRDEYCDDSTLMLLNFLTKIGVKAVTLAGFDGIINGTENYYDAVFDRHGEKHPQSEKVQRILDRSFGNLKRCFLTQSQYR